MNLVLRNELQINGVGASEIYTKTLSENTKKAYIRDIKDFFGVEEITNITLEMLRSVNVSCASEFRESLRSKGLAISTVNRKLTSLSNFYNFLSRREVAIVEYNPFLSSEGTVRMKNRRNYSNTRCLTKEEVKQMIIYSMKSKNIVGMRDTVVLMLLATTGMRREEVVNIKLSGFSTTKGKDIIEIVGKGEKERIIVLSKTTKKLIEDYLEMRGLSLEDKNEYLVTNHMTGANEDKNTQLSEKTVYNIVKKIAKKSGVGEDNISPHCFRHTYATESLEMGIDLKDVADLMGHASMNTTRRYEHTHRVLTHNPANALEKMFTE